MELLHGMEEVHEEGDQTDPEGRHGHENKPLANRQLSVVRCGAHDTDKSYKVDYLQQHFESVKSSSLDSEYNGPHQQKTLENTRDSFNIAGVPSQVDLDVGLGYRGVGLKFHPPFTSDTQYLVPAKDFSF